MGLETPLQMKLLFNKCYLNGSNRLIKSNKAKVSSRHRDNYNKKEELPKTWQKIFLDYKAHGMIELDMN